jgi:hypothetical protein
VNARGKSFRFVQLDLPGRLGIDDGRYLLRSDDLEGEETVVVIQTLGTPPPRRRARRRRPRRAAPDSTPALPLTRLTVIPAEPGPASESARELERIARDPDAAEAAVTAGLRSANRILGVHRVVTADPYGHEISRDTALVTRVGYGAGEEVADGRWEDALEIPPPERHLRRVEALRPQERLAAVLARRESIDVCERLLLRARADVDQGRLREAALQLRVGIEAMLAELPGRYGPDQGEDLAALERRREATAVLADEALRSAPPPGSADQIAETLAICERVLRRRRILTGEEG